MVRSEEDGWRAGAACAQTDGSEWFPPARGTISPLVFKTCAACPVWRECLLYAVGRIDVWHGVWAGLVPGELEALRDQLVAGDLGGDLVEEARLIVEGRGDRTAVHDSALPNPIPGRDALRERRSQVREALRAAGLLIDEQSVSRTATTAVKPGRAA